MKIAIGCDHGGYLLKQDILIWMEEHDIDFEDVGCFSTESVDYPVYAEKVARAVSRLARATRVSSSAPPVSVCPWPPIRWAACAAPCVPTACRRK